jgi:hypothetical protein
MDSRAGWTELWARYRRGELDFDHSGLPPAGSQGSRPTSMGHSLSQHTSSPAAASMVSVMSTQQQQQQGLSQTVTAASGTPTSQVALVTK